MPNISKINGLTLCDETNVNAITIADITNIDGITKSCVTCTTIQLAYDRESCLTACRGRCVDYGTDGTPGSLQVGDKIYEDFATCSECAADGYYADAPCGDYEQGCFTVESCIIQRIDRCR